MHEFKPLAGGMLCRQTCDPLTEYRRYAYDKYCTTKMSAGSSCLSSYHSYYPSTANPDDTCQSGLCGGPLVTGRAVQVDPIKPTLKAHGTKRLKLYYDEPPSHFADNFNLRRHSPGPAWVAVSAAMQPPRQRTVQR